MAARPARWPDDEVIDGVTVRHLRVRGEGLDLHVAAAGAGPPVILLHGFHEKWRSWRWWSASSVRWSALRPWRGFVSLVFLVSLVRPSH